MDRRPPSPTHGPVVRTRERCHARALAFLATAMLLGAACADGTDLPAGWKLDRESGALVHAYYGLSFPPVWNEMIRAFPTTYDSDGLNVSIGYYQPESRVALTFYVYPYASWVDPEEHFRGVVAAVVQTHPDAEIARAVRMRLPLGDASASGFNAFLHWWELSGEVGSFVILIPQQERMLKVRVTFQLDLNPEATENAWATVSTFLRSLELRPED